MKRNVRPDCDQDHSHRPTQDEIDVAIYLYDNLKTREGKVSGMEMGVFKGPEAYKCLEYSPWSNINREGKPQNPKYPLLFESRQSIIDFLSTMMCKGLFKKSYRLKKKLEAERKSRPDYDEEAEKQRLEAKEKRKQEKLQDMSLSAQMNSMNKKILPKLVFVRDAYTFEVDEPFVYYVWVFDRPATLKTYLLGALMLIGVIFCCFFPIWPSFLRSIVYYITVGICIFMAFVAILGVIRLILYTLLNIVTKQRLHFWLFPNLFADCSVVESFKPLYELTWTEGVSGLKAKAE